MTFHVPIPCPKIGFSENNDKKSYFEVVFSTVVKINDEVSEKKEIEKILLCDVQVEIYPELEKAFENMLNNSGYTGMKIEKKIDFENLYNQRFNYQCKSF